MKQLKQFLRALHEEGDEGEGIPEEWGEMISQEGYGTVFLSPEESVTYRVIVSDLMARYSRDGLFSRRAVERELRAALLAALGRPEDDRNEFPRRLDDALQQLRTRLRRDASSYTVFVPIAGADTKGLPFRFGNLRFVTFNDSQIRKFREAIREHKVSAEQVDLRVKKIRRLRESSLWEEPCAVVKVTAKDPKAAEEIAARETQHGLDALNFFSDLTPYQHGRLYMPGERSSEPTVTPILEDTSSWSIPYGTAGPGIRFDFTKLRDAERLRRVFERVHRMAQKEGVNEVDDLLLSAVRWAGRAAVEARDDEAFLLYAIALESAVLPGGGHQELGYRLRMRVAHLLSDRLQERKEWLGVVKGLYRIRSKIVHSGWYDLEPDDLRRMREVAKGILLLLLSHKGVSRLRSAKEFEEWFEHRLLT